jgi:uncharacterized protein YjbI with pentapeptide repeats
LQDADLHGADLSDADLERANLARADLRNANFHDVRWQKIATVKKANVFGIRNAPSGFLDWAKQNGAVSIESDTDWLAMLEAEQPKG